MRNAGDEMNIHQRIRDIRKSKGVTQKHIAEKCLLISTSAYCMKEKGKRPFRADELLKIACELNVNPQIFFGDQINKMRIKPTGTEGVE
jgi:transcriptional regulator with XRE-family HTH domain